MDKLQGSSEALADLRLSTHLCALKHAVKATIFWCPSLAFQLF